MDDHANTGWHGDKAFHLCSYLMRVELIGHTSYLETIRVLHVFQLQIEVKAFDVIKYPQPNHIFKQSEWQMKNWLEWIFASNNHCNYPLSVALLTKIHGVRLTFRGLFLIFSIATNKSSLVSKAISSIDISKNKNLEQDCQLLQMTRLRDFLWTGETTDKNLINLILKQSNNMANFLSFFANSKVDPDQPSIFPIIATLNFKKELPAAFLHLITWERQ